MLIDLNIADKINSLYIQYGHLNLVEFLIEKNANVNHTNEFGATPLLMASKVRFFITLMLLYCGNICCFQNGHLDVVRFLIEKGANVDQTDKNDRTPLCVASLV